MLILKTIGTVSFNMRYLYIEKFLKFYSYFIYSLNVSIKKLEEANEAKRKEHK